MREVVAELNERDIDLLLLGGDFSHVYYWHTLQEISKTVTTDGIFGVQGNHDRLERIFPAKEANEITPLGNSGVHVRDGFYLAGVYDLWLRNANVAEAIEGANADDFVLLVSHNPDIAMQQPTAGIDLILSGHTHGGQITFFGYAMFLHLGSITDYGTRFARGFAYSADGVPVFTTTGVGPYFTAPRVFARPEVVILTMFTH
jgi:predicted MPP superfamily phosphohydrolase